MSARPDLELAVRAALHYLERASDAWRNGDPRDGGPLHWPVAIAEARRALTAALEALPVDALANDADAHYLVDAGTGAAEELPDALAGMAWYNSISRAERAYWHQLARSAAPADAWEAYRRERP